MIYLTAVLLGLILSARTRRRRQVEPAVTGATATRAPAARWGISLPGLPWAGPSPGIRHGRRGGTYRRGRGDELGQVLSIALSAGLPLAAALEFAAEQVEPQLGGEVRTVLRNARSRGLAAALTEADGSARRLLGALARAQVTGASVRGAVAAYVDEDRKERRAAAREAAQRLPVKITVPLALLILPGFVLLTIGPTVIATVERLLGPLVP